MKITKIFLDLDDVLNFCTMAALKEVGCPVHERQFSAYDHCWGFDIVKAANALTLGKRMFTSRTFWKRIGRNFWANALKSDECDWLISISAGIVGRENVFILTSPTKDPDCSAGKVKWIQRRLPGWIHRQYIITPRKYVCARPGHLLIDDSDKNLVDWRKYDGVGILVPRPWNSAWWRHLVETKHNIARQLEKLQHAGT